MKKDFIDHITHELNTPLSTIKLATSTLQKQDSIKNNKVAGSSVEMINRQNTKLQKMLGNVIDLNMLEQEKIRPKPKTIELVAVYELMKTLKMNYPGKNIRFVLHDKNDLGALWFDPYYFEVLMLNLLDNAIKFSGNEPVIDMTVEDKQNFISIVIADKGQGIKEDSLDKVFRKFYRESKPTQKGLGFGLYYAKKIIKAHKGNITIDSKPGGGTRILLQIPRS